MKKHNYSDFENYILMADKCNINQSYSSFLDFGFYHGNTKFGSFSFKVLVAYNQ